MPGFKCSSAFPRINGADERQIAFVRQYLKPIVTENGSIVTLAIARTMFLLTTFSFLMWDMATYNGEHANDPDRTPLPFDHDGPWITNPLNWVLGSVCVMYALLLYAAVQVPHATPAATDSSAPMLTPLHLVIVYLEMLAPPFSLAYGILYFALLPDHSVVHYSSGQQAAIIVNLAVVCMEIALRATVAKFTDLIVSACAFHFMYVWVCVFALGGGVVLVPQWFHDPHGANSIDVLAYVVSFVTVFSMHLATILVDMAKQRVFRIPSYVAVKVDTGADEDEAFGGAALGPMPRI